LNLVDHGKLARVVAVLSDLKPLPGKQIADPRLRTITVRHPLLHAGGLMRDAGRVPWGPLLGRSWINRMKLRWWRFISAC
jgi:hypothetical protein